MNILRMPIVVDTGGVYFVPAFSGLQVSYRPCIMYI